MPGEGLSFKKVIAQLNTEEVTGISTLCEVREEQYEET
jgi:hypothetical protein